MIRRTHWICLAALLLTESVSADPPNLEHVPFWTTSELGVNTTGMIWRDCNNDGVIDAFFTNGNDIVPSTNMLYYFNGTPLSDAAGWRSVDGAYSGHGAVGDINDDGLVDLVVSNSYGIFGEPGYANLYYNHSGVLSPAPEWLTPDLIYSFSCALGDVDGDGDLDLAFATGEGIENTPFFHVQNDLIYLNDGGVFSPMPWWESDVPTVAKDVTWGDVDNDGDLDLAFVYAGNRAAVYYNNSGVIEEHPSWRAGTTEMGYMALFSDVDGDGWRDLIIAYNTIPYGPVGNFRVYFNDGTGSLSSTYGWESDENYSGGGSSIAVYDYDQDGDDDLAAGQWYSKLQIYENTGTTFSTEPVWLSDFTMVAEEVAWVDLDGNSVVFMTDTLSGDGARRLFYTKRHPLYAIDSVKSDGVKLPYADFCYDLIPGWVSLAYAPVSECVVYYRYSFENDLTVSNWDTVSMAFGDPSAGLIDMYVEPKFGVAPLAVTVADLSQDVLNRDWDFGNGQHSTDSCLVQVFDEPGIYPVRLSVTKPTGTFTRGAPVSVVVRADTLRGEQVAARQGDKVKVDIVATNYLPVNSMEIPFKWQGELDVSFDSISTNGLRTEYFAEQTLVNYVAYWESATVSLKAGNRPVLPPGNAAVVSLWFTVNSNDASCPIQIASYSTHEPIFSTVYGDYTPTLVPGMVDATCCQGQTGDVNGVGGDEPTIGDISTLIDFLFITGSPLPCLAEADVNQSGGIEPTPADLSVSDISTLIDYLFITGAPLKSCF